MGSQEDFRNYARETLNRIHGVKRACGQGAKMIHSRRERATRVKGSARPKFTPTPTASWVDRIKSAVASLPLPGAVVYLGAAAVAVGLFMLNDWLALGRPIEALAPFHLVLALGPVYALALLHLLDIQAGRALAGMRPLIKPSDAYDALRRDLTTLPRGRAWIGGLGGLLIGLAAVLLERFALPAAFRPYVMMGAARPFVEVWLALSWFILGGLFVHTHHQLTAINRIYTHHTVIDLDNYQPLFHFSAVSALTAVGLLLIPYAWYAAVPNLIREPVGVLFGALFIAFGAIAFLWPLVGVRNLIAAAKGRALEENAHVLREAREKLYADATRGDLTGASELSDALAAIRAEREALLRIPTWPWEAGTIRSVIVALALPVAIWLLQFALERVIGP